MEGNCAPSTKVAVMRKASQEVHQSHGIGDENPTKCRGISLNKTNMVETSKTRDRQETTFKKKASEGVSKSLVDRKR